MARKERTFLEEWWMLLLPPIITAFAVLFLIWMFFKVTVKRMFKPKKKGGNDEGSQSH